MVVVRKVRFADNTLLRLGALVALLWTSACGSEEGSTGTGAGAADSNGAQDALDALDGTVAEPTSCEKNKKFCHNGAVWACDVTGKPVGVLTTCGADEVCAVQAGVAVCAKADTVDTNQADTGEADSSEADTGEADSSEADSSEADSSEADTGEADSSQADTGEADTGEADTGEADTAVADASNNDVADVDQTCTKNKQFCAGDTIRYCTAAGTWGEIKQTCGTGTTCQLEGGVPVCKAPPVETDVSGTDTTTTDTATTDTFAEDTTAPDDTASSDTAVEDTSVSDAVGDTSANDTVEDADVAKTCTPNKQFCDGDVVRYCTAGGLWGGIKTTCILGKTCVVIGGVAQCGVPGSDSDAGSTDTADAADTAVNDTTTTDTAVNDTTTTDTAVNDTTTTDTVTSDTATSDTSANDTADTADTTPTKTCTPNKNFCDGDKVVSCKNDGTPGVVKYTCEAGNVCGIDGNAAVCIKGTYSCTGDSCTCTPQVPDKCVKVVKSGTTLGYVYGVEKRTACYQNTTVIECAEFNSCYEGQCTSSVKDPNSPYWYKSCDLTQYLNAKTSLPADCRCLVNQALSSGLVPCKRPYEVFKAGGSIGEGPRAAGLSNVSMQGGYIESTGAELFVAVSWGSSTDRKGMILGVTLATGKRRVISGVWQESGAPQSKGTGPDIKYPTDLRLGPGGKMLLLADAASAKPEVLSIDPTTGDRTLHWRAGDSAFGQCKAGDGVGSVQYTAYGFAVDSDGSFFLGYANPLTDGRGVVRISADGKTCTSVTGSGSKNGSIDKGTGNALGGFVQGFELLDGKLYVLTTQPKSLWSIDLATGNRVQVVTVGTATGLGERRVVWDAARKWFWVSGVQSSTTITAYEPATDTLFNVDKSCGTGMPFATCWGGPININTLNYGGLFLHPSNGHVYFGHDAMSVVEVEPETGNSITISL